MHPRFIQKLYFLLPRVQFSAEIGEQASKRTADKIVSVKVAPLSMGPMAARWFPPGGVAVIEAAFRCMS